jgi:hypothetical protein
MILDKLGTLCDAQALTATAISANVVDLGAAANGLPDGEPLEVVLSVDVAADATTGDETYDVSVDTSAVVGLTTPTQLISRTIAAADLAAGSKHHFPLPQGVNMLRYLGINFTLGGTTPSMTVTASVQPVSMAGETAVNKHYPSGSVIA